MVFDVDTGDIVNLAATDQTGAAITDFSGWTVVGSGDVSAWNGGAGYPDPAAAPTWSGATGTLTAADALNANRSFTILKPDVAISTLSVELTAASGEHIFSTLYGHPTPELSLGNFVWFDTNNNGIFDSGESPTANVRLELLDSTGAVLRTTTTDANGAYLFDDLPEGRYAVRVASSNFQTGGPLVDYRSSLYSSEPTVPNNEDINLVDTGTEAPNLATGGITSPWYDLFYDSEPDNDGDLLRSTNLTVDFGLVRVASAGGPTTPTTPLAPNTGILPVNYSIIYVLIGALASLGIVYLITRRSVAKNK